MKHLVPKYLLLSLWISISCSKDDPVVVSTATPPFSGTIFADPNIITDACPNAFKEVTFKKPCPRTMFDRRVDDWVTVNALTFEATYDDGMTIEIQVNPEFQTVDLAQVEAAKYAEAIGRLPAVLRKDVKTVSIHKGTELFGGGNNNILIHTGQTKNYEDDGILDETLMHEAAHTSLDAAHSKSPGWLESQKADGNFISTYAHDNPLREDIAESFLMYFAIKYKSSNISPALRNKILETIPNRIKYFENQSFNMHPY